MYHLADNAMLFMRGSAATIALPDEVFEDVALEGEDVEQPTDAIGGVIFFIRGFRAVVRPGEGAEVCAAKGLVEETEEDIDCEDKERGLDSKWGGCHRRTVSASARSQYLLFLGPRYWWVTAFAVHQKRVRKQETVLFCAEMA